MERHPQHTQVKDTGAPRPVPGRQELLAMPARRLVEVFHGLEAPTLGEMRGAFHATLLDQGPKLVTLVARGVVTWPARWLAKAFEPQGAEGGHGHNVVRFPWGVRRLFRMRTFVGPSRIAEGDAYHLDYSAFNRGPMGTMWDEVRRVSEGLYLGLGRMGYTERQRRHLMPFMLEGPPEPFVSPGQE
ncbi:MAG: hypothetical protein ACODAU_10035 [Myxococcota bacterium]